MSNKILYCQRKINFYQLGIKTSNQKELKIMMYEQLFGLRIDLLKMLLK